MEIRKFGALGVCAYVCAALAADQEIIVTADPLRHAEQHLVQPITVVTGDALARSGARNVGEAVVDQLGVSASDFGVNVGRPIIRGLGGARVRVLEDGIGAMDVSTVSPDHAVAVESGFAQQIEIFRGPATLLYGSGASGGLVNVVEDRILSELPQALGGEVTLNFDGATESKTGGMRLNSGLGQHFALHLEALKARAENYEIPNFAAKDADPDAPRKRLPHSQSDNENFAGGLSYVGARGFIGVAVQRLERSYGVPGANHHAEHEKEEGHAEEESGVNIDQAQTRFDVKGEWREPLPGLVAARTRWGFNDHRHTEFEPSGAPGTLLINNEWEGRFELVHAMVGEFEGVCGVQLQDRAFDARGDEAFVPRSDQQSVAGFWVEKADFGNLHIDLGARVEHSETEDLVASRYASFDAYSLSGGVNYRYREGYEVGAALTRALRSPSIEELFAQGPHLATNTFEIGDAALNAEKSTNLELFWRKTSDRWRLDLGIFYNDIGDFIVAREVDGNGDGIADRVAEDFLESGEILADEDALLLLNQQQAGAKFWGFELESVFTLFDDTRGRLAWRLWTDYVEASLDDEGRVPRLPPLRYGTGLTWEYGAWTVDSRLTRVNDAARLAHLETPTDGYTLFDVGVEYVVGLPDDRALIWFARGKNLLNEEIRRHTSFLKDEAPLPGMSGFIGVRLQF